MQIGRDILLVEDNSDDAELILRALAREGLDSRVHRLKDGAEARTHLLGARAAEPRPRVVILDLKMPRVDGLELLKDLRADARTRTIPVVVLTSSGEPRDLAATYELLVNSYVIKPIVSDEFARVIGDLGRYWTRVNSVPSA